MSGHGWVTPNPDGSKARCGGPAICSECAREKAAAEAATAARLNDAGSAVRPGNTTPAETLRRAATLMRERAEAATPGPWWSDESDECWRLHGVAFTTPPFLNADGSVLVPGQVVNSQILKAPKKGTPYAEYWPGAADDAHITSWHPLVALAVSAWLESEAKRAERPGALKLTSVIPGPLAVARAYLGETDEDLARADAAASLDDDLDEEPQP